MSHERAPKQYGSFVFHYYPTGPNNPFGHLAVGDFKIIENGSPKDYHDDINSRTGYLAYHGGTGLVREDPGTFMSDYGTYDSNCISFEMPPCSADKLKQAIKTFGELKFEDYSLANKNCATAVWKFLKEAGVFAPENVYDPRHNTLQNVFVIYY